MNIIETVNKSDSLYIASNMDTQNNPIGTCLWFVTNTYYNNNVYTSGSTEYWNFGTGNKEVVEKYYRKSYVL